MLFPGRKIAWAKEKLIGEISEVLDSLETPKVRTKNLLRIQETSGDMLFRAH